MARRGRSAAETHTEEGNVLFHFGQFDEAIAEYGRAIEAGPRHDEAHIGLAESLRALGRHEEAVAAYDGALGLCPDNHFTHHSRAESLLALGRNKEAIAALDRALELDPDDVAVQQDRKRALGAPRRAARGRRGAEPAPPSCDLPADLPEPVRRDVLELVDRHAKAVRPAMGALAPGMPPGLAARMMAIALIQEAVMEEFKSTDAEYGRHVVDNRLAGEDRDAVNRQIGQDPRLEGDILRGISGAWLEGLAARAASRKKRGPARPAATRKKRGAAKTAARPARRRRPA